MAAASMAVLEGEDEEGRALALQREIEELEAKQKEVEERLRAARPIFPPRRQFAAPAMPAASSAAAATMAAAAAGGGGGERAELSLRRPQERRALGLSFSRLPPPQPQPQPQHGNSPDARDVAEAAADARSGKRRRLQSTVGAVEVNEADEVTMEAREEQRAGRNGRMEGQEGRQAWRRSSWESPRNSGRSFMVAGLEGVRRASTGSAGAGAAGGGGSKEEAEEGAPAPPPPPRPIVQADPTTRKRNRKMFGALLLGTLEKFREEDQKLQDSEAFTRRSMLLKKAEQKAAEEREMLRQKDREKQLEQRRMDLTLRARLAAKAEEKDVQLLLLHWRKHHSALTAFFRTEAKPPIFFRPKEVSTALAPAKARQKEAFESWAVMRTEEVKGFAAANLQLHLAAVEQQLLQQQMPLRQGVRGTGPAAGERRGSFRSAAAAAGANKAGVKPSEGSAPAEQRGGGGYGAEAMVEEKEARGRDKGEADATVKTSGMDVYGAAAGAEEEGSAVATEMEGVASAGEAEGGTGGGGTQSLSGVGAATEGGAHDGENAHVKEHEPGLASGVVSVAPSAELNSPEKNPSEGNTRRVFHEDNSGVAEEPNAYGGGPAEEDEADDTLKLE